MGRLTVITALLLAALGTASAAPASAGPEGLTECAELELRVAGLFRVGTASLHLNECADGARILEAVPKQFSLRLARSFSGSDLTETARDTLVDNLGLDGHEDLPEDLACMAEAYVDAGDGDRFDVTYLPGEHLSLYLNEELLRRCEDLGQGEKYFMIWFGDDPFHRRMRDRLLEQAAANAAG